VGIGRKTFILTVLILLVSSALALAGWQVSRWVTGGSKAPSTGSLKMSVLLDALEGLSGIDVSTRVTSDKPVVAERAMYFDYYGKNGGSDCIGIPFVP
jgi:hypothetical protein